MRAGRGREPSAEMDAPRLLDLLDLLDERGIRVWVAGGWGIDALLGEQTRPHDDLDLVARLEDGGAPLAFELVDREGHQVDVHPAAFGPDGDGVYRRANGEDWIYPAAALTGVGSVLGREVTCLAPDAALLNHTTGYEPDEAHRRDVRLLRERYGL